MTVITDLIGKRVRLFYLDTGESYQAKQGYRGRVRLASLDGGTLTFGVELEEQVDNPTGGNHISAGTILFFRNHSSSYYGSHIFDRPFGIEIL